jgi:competence ComEA-like helix-hairpin-helix protein
MSRPLNELIEKRQEQLRVRDRQMRRLWIALGVLAILALAYLWLREDPSTAPVNVNTASIENLCYLPEVGPEIAQRIIAARPYSQPEDLLKVKGIGPATLNKIKPRLRFTDD